ncbi:MAG: hypothetical protein VX589_13910 [Myxococcota bacterium]|nr:hypothetical protein [Myxococcota bacterium]
MVKMNVQRWMFIWSIALGFLGCGNDFEAPVETDLEEKDSGWLADDSYEVNAVLTGIVQQAANGDWADLQYDDELQAQLVDQQIKFAKNTAEANGWRFNQLAENVVVDELTVADNIVTIKYRATVDMLGRLGGFGFTPRLATLENAKFDVTVPLFPASIQYEDYKNCGETDDPDVWVRGYNFHYYFKPTKAECEMALGEVDIQVTEVFERVIAYPEYDRLLQDLDSGRLGFRAALVPNRGDNDPMSRFDAHRKMLESDLGLRGTDSADGRYRSYVYERGGVAIEIDLYNPTVLEGTDNFADGFRRRLAEYTLVHYNGHSSYGSKHLLDDPEAYSDAYQIIIMHSCQSYAYYSRQVFRAKATSADPAGFDGADVIATGKSSYPSGSPPTTRALLSSLMAGMVAVNDGQPEQAPDWLTISERITDSTWGDILYGVAGVRTNKWQP